MCISIIEHRKGEGVARGGLTHSNFRTKFDTCRCDIVNIQEYFKPYLMTIY